MRRRGLAPAAAAVGLTRSRVQPVPARDVPWLLLLPAIAIAAPAIALLAAPLGDALLAPADLRYWQDYAIVHKSATQAGYLLFCAAGVAFAALVAWAIRRPLRLDPEAGRVLVLATQVIGLAFLLTCWIVQRDVHSLGVTRVYFTTATVVVAVALVALTVLLARAQAPARTAPLAARLRAALAVRPDGGSATLRWSCLAAAVALTVVWLLPSIYTDRGVAAGPPEILIVNGFVFDEALAVLNGRSPLVDMAAYGSLWPYAIALPFGALGGSFAAFTTLMTAITGASLLAVYGLLRRAAGNALAALALYLPFLATSLFVQHGTAVARYDPGNYFGIFPLRYAGPYLLAWLTVWTVAALARDPARGRRATVVLFACAGLVAVNNLDFGVSALAASVVALGAAATPRSRGELRALAVRIAAGLALALALVCALTLLRAGSLPHPGWLLRYGRAFTSGGWGNLALPGLGLHLAISATFVAALATAAVRAASGAPGRALTAALAWTGVFGLGAGVYYYAYRSHPDVLINLFSVWALALALLTVVAVRSLRTDRLPSLPALAVLLGFGLAACSLAQLPLPWQQVQRIARDSGSEPYRERAVAARVEAITRPGEHVLLFHSLGHRVAEEAGVVNVSPYTGLMQMPTREQLDEALELLADAGGRRILLAEEPWVGMAPVLRRAGYVRQPAAPGDPVVEWLATEPASP
jgi:hypothetical protein